MFTSLRTRCNNLYRRLRNSHFQNVCLKYKQSPKLLWSTINHITNRCRSHIPPAVAADELNTFFHKIVTDPNPRYDIPDGPPPQSAFGMFKQVTVTDVRARLASLDSSKAPGPDCLLPSILKATSNVIAPSISAIFNTSLQSSTFPHLFKIANITPILKVITLLRPTIAQCRLRAFSAKCSNVLPLTNCCGTSTCILVYTIINLASGPSDQQCRS